jgi:hypothetical protein
MNVREENENEGVGSRIFWQKVRTICHVRHGRWNVKLWPYELRGPTSLDHTVNCDQEVSRMNSDFESPWLKIHSKKGYVARFILIIQITTVQFGDSDRSETNATICDGMCATNTPERNSSLSPRARHGKPLRLPKSGTPPRHCDFGGRSHSTLHRPSMLCRWSFITAICNLLRQEFRHFRKKFLFLTHKWRKAEQCPTKLGELWKDVLIQKWQIAVISSTLTPVHSISSQFCPCFDHLTLQFCSDQTPIP